MKYAGKLFNFLLIACLFISPFVFNPKAAIPFEIPKVWLIRIWIELLIIFGILSLGKVKILNPKNKWLLISLFGFAIVAVLSSFWGMDFSKSWVGNYYRQDGLFTFLHLFILAFLIGLISSEQLIKYILKAIGFSVIVLAVWCVADWVLINIFGKFAIPTWIDGGIGIAFGNPNFLAGYFLAGLIPLMFLLDNFTQFKNKFLKTFIWVVVFFAIYTTKSWTGIFGSLIFLAFSAFIQNFGFKKKITALVLVLSGILVLTIFSKTLIKSLGEINVTNSTNTPGQIDAESRQRIYTKGILAFINRPIGYGWSNFDKAFASIDWPIHFNNDVYVDKAHSSILETAVTTGIAGLIFYLLIIIFTIKNYLKFPKRLSKYLLFTFLILVLHMQTNIVSVSEELLFWVFVGQAVNSP